MTDIKWRDYEEGKVIWRDFCDLDMTWAHLCNLFSLYDNRHAVRVKIGTRYIVNQAGLRASYRKAGYQCSLLADMADTSGMLRDFR